MGPCMCVAVGTTVVSIEGMSTSPLFSIYNPCRLCIMDRNGEPSQPPPPTEDDTQYMTRWDHSKVRGEFNYRCEALERRQDEQFSEARVEFKNIDNRFEEVRG